LKVLSPVSDEQSSTLVVEGLLSLKRGPDAALLELENDARDALLEKVSCGSFKSKSIATQSRE
jgi:hypothetical protein